METQHIDPRSANKIFLRASREVWRFFSSIRVAVFLILVIIGLCLIGVLLIQVPREVASDPVAYAQWLDSIGQSKVGILVHTFAFLCLFDVFHSPLFLLMGALLAANIMVCSVNRWKALRRFTLGGQTRQAEKFYLKGDNQAEFTDLPVPPEKVAGVISNMLKSHHYRLHTETFGEYIYLAADKNTYSRLGTYLIHLSIILLIIGFLVGSYLGFRDPSFIITEGSVREVGHGTNLSLRLQSFADEYWPDGTPKDYRSEVVIYEAGHEVKRGVIRVNHPLSYNGIRFYQAFFGPTAVMKVRTVDDEVLFHSDVALVMSIESGAFEYPLGSFNLPAQGFTAYVVGPALNIYDTVIGAEHVGLQLYRNDSTVLIPWTKLSRGESYRFEGLEFTFLQEGEYSGFQVSSDPCIFLIWIASGLFLLGLGAVFYFPYCQVWGLVEPKRCSRSRVLIRSAANRSLRADSKFQGLVNELGKQFAYDEKVSDGKE